MGRDKSGTPNNMRKVYRRFQRWRSSHTGCLPIPEPLWAAAGHVILIPPCGRRICFWLRPQAALCYLLLVKAGGTLSIPRLEAKLRDYVYPILCQSPHSGSNIERLKNWDPRTWRYRVGNWRFFYEIDERHHIVFMTAADHRLSLAHAVTLRRVLYRAT
jgi:mRNA interferase RelE/StbE